MVVPHPFFNGIKLAMFMAYCGFASLAGLIFLSCYSASSYPYWNWLHCRWRLFHSCSFLLLITFLIFISHLHRSILLSACMNLIFRSLSTSHNGGLENSKFYFDVSGYWVRHKLLMAVPPFQHTIVFMATKQLFKVRKWLGCYERLQGTGVLGPFLSEWQVEHCIKATCKL